MTRLLSRTLLVFAALLTLADAASAQPIWLRPRPVPSRPRRPPSGPSAAPVTLDDMPRHVVSTGPSAWLFVLPNLEYEVRTVRFLTVGASASRSHWTLGHESTNGELLARIFPAGIAFNGAALGLRAGRTHISGKGDFRTLSVEGGYTMTAHKRAYMSLSVGARHIYDGPESVFGANHPIVRMNIGVGF